MTENLEDGFSFERGDIFSLVFTIPRQKDATTIQNAELWLFPSPKYQRSFVEGTILEMVLLVVVKLAHAKHPRQEIMTITWDTQTSCIPLSMTSLSKKISKNLEKRDLEEANITVTIEVVNISQLTDPVDSSSSSVGFLDVCNGLAGKRTNTPFFVVKYYSDDPFNAYMSSGSSLELQPPNKRKRELLSSPGNSDGPVNNCSIVPLVVDLTEVYGPFIIKPERVDISDCSGNCNVLVDSSTYTLHATILERLKLKGTAKRDVCCIPIAYESQDLLIFHSYYLVLVQFKDMIVTECACH